MSATFEFQTASSTEPELDNLASEARQCQSAIERGDWTAARNFLQTMLYRADIVGSLVNYAERSASIKGGN
jgi:hypothetical protein